MNTSQELYDRLCLLLDSPIDADGGIRTKDILIFRKSDEIINITSLCKEFNIVNYLEPRFAVAD